MFEGENAHFDEVTKEELAARTKTLDVSSIRLKEMVLDYAAVRTSRICSSRSSASTPS